MRKETSTFSQIAALGNVGIESLHGNLCLVITVKSVIHLRGSVHRDLRWRKFCNWP